MSTDKPLLDLFWKLIEAKEATRINAAFKIVSYIQQKDRINQVQYNSKSCSKDEENTLNNGVDEKDNVTAYCVQRCIRGLASSKDASRNGFFICLVELLRMQKVDSATLWARTLVKQLPFFLTLF